MFVFVLIVYLCIPAQQTTTKNHHKLRRELQDLCGVPPGRLTDQNPLVGKKAWKTDCPLGKTIPFRARDLAPLVRPGTNLHELLRVGPDYLPSDPPPHRHEPER